jgi:hypothetical protein
MTCLAPRCKSFSCLPILFWRYDKLAANYLAFIKLASIRTWLRAYESRLANGNKPGNAHCYPSNADFGERPVVCNCVTHFRSRQSSVSFCQRSSSRPTAKIFVESSLSMGKALKPGQLSPVPPSILISSTLIRWLRCPVFHTCFCVKAPNLN